MAAIRVSKKLISAFYSSQKKSAKKLFLVETSSQAPGWRDGLP